MDGTGQYRTRGADGLSHTAFVSDRSISFDIGEQLYRWRGYSPPFDQLPWMTQSDILSKRLANRPTKQR